MSVADPNPIARRIVDGRYKTAAALVADEKPVSWLVHDLILFGDSISAWYGPQRVAKSFSALDTCLSVATGTPVFGMERLGVPHARPVLYVTEEDSARRVGQRIAALARGRDLDPAKIPDNFLVAARTGIHLDRDMDQNNLIAAARQFEASLVVLDPIARLSRCVGWDCKRIRSPR